MRTRAAKAVESLFFGRDESWMRFNQRVLEEAEDATQSAAGAGEVSGDYGEQPG